MLQRTILLPAFTLLLYAQVRSADFAGPNQFICGTSTIMGANALGAGETGYWTVLAGTADFFNANAPNTPVTGLSYGENVLQWTILAPGGPVSDQVSIWCYNSAMPLANAGPDQVASAPPGTAQLSGSTPIAPGVCFWVVVAGTASIANPTDPNTTVSSLGVGQNVFSWSCDNGPCGSSSDVVVIEASEVIGIEEAGSDAFIMHYDASGQRLVFGSSSTPRSITLFDEQGRVVDRLNAPAGSGVWDLSGSPNGVYVAQISSGGLQRTLRFVVTR
ncbi:MAG: T9SS type A sorting domain-containing protein [Flavobacteriales bacterium]|nr:T9SS type A sorting domain-containing protein [Flavobacteriales bacterium]MCC6939938.1 T9SS type A sorting domain-containing protein [Flavobacteriales bacterium]